MWVYLNQQSIAQLPLSSGSDAGRFVGSFGASDAVTAAGATAAGGAETLACVSTRAVNR